MSDAPRACSLSAADQSDRAAEFRSLARQSLVERKRDEGAVRLSFRADPDVRAVVEDLARRERECCSFLDFSVQERDGRVTLAIAAAAAEERPALDAFYELAG